MSFNQSGGPDASPFQLDPPEKISTQEDMTLEFDQEYLTSFKHELDSLYIDSSDFDIKTILGSFGGSEILNNEENIIPLQAMLSVVNRINKTPEGYAKYNNSTIKMFSADYDEQTSELRLIHQGEVIMKYQLEDNEGSLCYTRVADDIDQATTYSTDEFGSLLKNYSEEEFGVYSQSEINKSTGKRLSMDLYTSQSTLSQKETSSRDIQLPEGLSKKLTGSEVSGKSVTINSIFAEPKPQEIELSYADVSPDNRSRLANRGLGTTVRARLTPSGYMTVSGESTRPLLFQNVVIKNVGDHQRTIESPGVVSLDHEKKELMFGNVDHLRLDECVSSSGTIYLDYKYTVHSEKGKITATYDSKTERFVDAVSGERVYIRDGILVGNLDEAPIMNNQFAIDEIQGSQRNLRSLPMIDSLNSPQEQKALQYYKNEVLESDTISIDKNSLTWKDVWIDDSRGKDEMVFQIDTPGLNEEYHKNLRIDMDEIITSQGKYDAGKFSIKLGEIVTKIIRSTVVIVTDEPKEDEKKGPSEVIDTHKKTKSFSEVSAPKPPSSYRTPEMTYCSRAAKDTAKAMFGLDIPQGHAKDAIAIDPSSVAASKTSYIGGGACDCDKRCCDMSTSEMVQLLDQYGSQGANVIDMGYKSQTPNGKKYGHRNLIFRNESDNQRYFIDPVINFGVNDVSGSHGRTSKPRPISCLTRWNKISFDTMRAYESDVKIV